MQININKITELIDGELTYPCFEYCSFTIDGNNYNEYESFDKIQFEMIGVDKSQYYNGDRKMFELFRCKTDKTILVLRNMSPFCGFELFYRNFYIIENDKVEKIDEEHFDELQMNTIDLKTYIFNWTSFDRIFFNDYVDSIFQKWFEEEMKKYSIAQICQLMLTIDRDFILSINFHKIGERRYLISFDC